MKGRRRLMATNKEGGRFKVILFMHTHDKTEAKYRLCGGDKESNKGRQST